MEHEEWLRNLILHLEVGTVMILIWCLLRWCHLIGFPMVRFASGLEMAVPPEKFLVKMGGGVIAIRRQLPLRLAWAISVHKSQVITTHTPHKAQSHTRVSYRWVGEIGRAHV